jgi:hypothetical protein
MTALDGILMLRSLHTGCLLLLLLLLLPGAGDATPEMALGLFGARVPRFWYMFIARDMVDLFAPNCRLSTDSGPVWPLNGETCSGTGTGTGRLDTEPPSDAVRALRTGRGEEGEGEGALAFRLAEEVFFKAVRGSQDMPERTHIVHGLVASH